MFSFTIALQVQDSLAFALFRSVSYVSVVPRPLAPFHCLVRVRVRDTMIAAGDLASLATRRSSPSLAGPSCSCSGRPVRALPSVSVVVHPVCSDPVLGCHCHCPHVFRCSETPNGVFSLLFVFAFGLRILHWARLGRPVRPFHYHLRSIFCSICPVRALLVPFVLSSSFSCSPRPVRARLPFFLCLVFVFLFVPNGGPFL